MSKNGHGNCTPHVRWDALEFTLGTQEKVVGKSPQSRCTAAGETLGKTGLLMAGSTVIHPLSSEASDVFCDHFVLQGVIFQHGAPGRGTSGWLGAAA